MGSTMKTYSTKQASKLIGIHLVTLKRWLGKRRIRPSVATPLGGRTFWRFTEADIARFRKFRGTLKPGPKPKKRKK